MSLHEHYLVNGVSHLDGSASLEDVELQEAVEEEGRVPRPVLFMKSVELILACGCLTAYVRASVIEENPSKVGLAWATFGSQVIVMTFMLVGYIVGETTPRLAVAQNGVGGVLFLASGASCLESWWDYQERMMGVILDSQANWDADMMLVTGLLALMNAALLFADTLVAAVLWRLAQVSRLRPWD